MSVVAQIAATLAVGEAVRIFIIIIIISKTPCTIVQLILLKIIRRKFSIFITCT